MAHHSANILLPVKPGIASRCRGAKNFPQFLRPRHHSRRAGTAWKMGRSLERSRGAHRENGRGRGVSRRLRYGVYHCLNAVTEREGVGAGVLIRALEPVLKISGRTRGPGLLCRAMRIDRRRNGHDLVSDEFFIAAPASAEKFTIVKRPRIGVDYARHWAKRLLRFYLRDDPFVSQP